MIIGADEKLRQKAVKDGSVLKGIRTSGGLGIGLIAGGIFLLIIGLLFGLPFIIKNPMAALVLFGVFAAPGALLLLFGMINQNKRKRTYIEHYAKKSGYDESVIAEADRQLLLADTVAIGNATQNTNGKPIILLYVTPDYLVNTAAGECYILPLKDIAAAFYSKEIPGINGYRHGLVYISKQDTLMAGIKNTYTGKQCGGYHNAMLDLQSCKEALDVICRRTDNIINSQYVRMSGAAGEKVYNLLSMDNWQEDWKELLSTAY